jgi:integrase
MSLVIDQNYGLSIEQGDLVKKTIAYEQASLAKNTRRTYAALWSKFEKWCQKNLLSSLPASTETISLFLGSLGGIVSFSTINSVIAAIEKTHKQQGIAIVGNQDIYRRVRKGIRREHKEKQTLKQAKALTLVELSVFCRQLGGSLQDLRDKAMITMAFFGAMRRSEIVSLDFEHIEFTEKGIVLSLLQTKTSDEVVRIYLTRTRDPSICPVIALKNWITASKINTGSLFHSLIKGGTLSKKRLTGHALANIMKQRFGNEYSGHSLRRGLITAVAEKGAPIHKIQQHSRHKTVDIIIRYIEKAEGFEHTSAITLGA